LIFLTNAVHKYIKMRQISVFFLLFLLINTISSAQPKIEVGLTTEGSWVMKKELTNRSLHTGRKSNWGTGLGAYVAVPIWWHFSVSGGITYRYSEIQKGTAIWTPYEDGYGEILTGYNFKKHQRRYLVIPFNLRFLVFRDWFISGGIEYCRLLNNYESIKTNKENNWTIGIGNQKYKLRWSLQYTRGVDEQRIKIPGDFMYKTKRLQLSLSYPLWTH